MTTLKDLPSIRGWKDNDVRQECAKLNLTSVDETRLCRVLQVMAEVLSPTEMAEAFRALLDTRGVRHEFRRHTMLRHWKRKRVDVALDAIYDPPGALWKAGKGPGPDVDDGWDDEEHQRYVDLEDLPERMQAEDERGLRDSQCSTRADAVDMWRCVGDDPESPMSIRWTKFIAQRLLEVEKKRVTGQKRNGMITRAVGLAGTGDSAKKRKVIDRRRRERARRQLAEAMNDFEPIDGAQAPPARKKRGPKPGTRRAKQRRRTARVPSWLAPPSARRRSP